MFGGVTGAIADKASRWGGDRDTWHGTKANLRQERAFPPERICNLPVGRVFVKHRNTRAFIARLGPVQDHPRYEPAIPADFPSACSRPSRSPRSRLRGSIARHRHRDAEPRRCHGQLPPSRHHEPFPD